MKTQPTITIDQIGEDLRCPGAMGVPCNYPAKWINQNGCICCDYHKQLVDAFTWESRDTRSWKLIKEVSND